MERPWAVDNASARSLLSVTRNLVKVFVAVGGAWRRSAAFGYPVATVLAGLGIGGIALAFGAQKTIENLFGSIALAADQPFRVGDFVKVEDFTGNVERIGMRSTQIRTLDRTLITLPNGKLADMRIEDFASRDRIRFAATVGLVYGTSEAQVRQVVDGIEQLLRGAAEGLARHRRRRGWRPSSPSSLDVEVLCWYRDHRLRRVPRLRQDALLGILRDRRGGRHEPRLPDADGARGRGRRDAAGPPRGAAAAERSARRVDRVERRPARAGATTGRAPGSPARRSSSRNTVSTSSGAPAAAAISSHVPPAAAAATRARPRTRRCRSSTAAAAFLPASTPGWW